MTSPFGEIKQIMTDRQRETETQRETERDKDREREKTKRRRRRRMNENRYTNREKKRKHVDSFRPAPVEELLHVSLHNYPIPHLREG